MMKKTIQLFSILGFLFVLNACDDIEELTCTEYQEKIDNQCVDLATYEVTFVVPDEIESIDTVVIYEGMLLSMPEVDTVLEYTWYTDSSFTTPFVATTPIEANTTLYLDLKDTFTITFVVPDDIEAMESIVVDYFTYLEKPDVDVINSYNWYIDDTFETPFNFAFTRVTEDITLYLKIDPIKYYAKLWNGLLEYGVITYYETDELANIPTPVIPGYTFHGWYSDPELTIPFDYTTLVLDEDNRVYPYIYADFTPNPERTITYIVNGEVLRVEHYLAGEIITLYHPDSTEVSTYRGWFIDAALIKYYSTEVMPNYNLTLYTDGVIHHYDMVSDLILNEPLNSSTGVVGTVVYADDYYAILKDGDYAVLLELPIPISAGGNATETFTVAVGMTVDVYGYYIHNSLGYYSFQNISDVIILSEDNPTNLDTNPVTVNQLQTGIATGTYQPLSVLRLTGYLTVNLVDGIYVYNEDQTYFIQLSYFDEQIYYDALEFDGTIAELEIVYFGSSTNILNEISYYFICYGFVSDSTE